MVTTAFGSNRPFSIYEISFYWYKLIGVILVWVTAIPLSYVWKRDDDEKYDPKLYSPIISRFLVHRTPKRMEHLPLKTPHPSLADGNTRILLPMSNEEAVNGTTS